MKNLFLIAILFVLNTAYSQDSKKVGAITAFAVKTDNIEELRKFDWTIVKESFKNNKDTDSIKISIQFNNNKTAADAGIPNIDNVAAEIKGQKSELRKMIRTARKLAKQIIKSEEER